MLVRTVQHLHVRHFTKDAGFFFSPLQPTSWSDSTRTCSISRKNTPCSTKIHLVSLKPSELWPCCLSPPDARSREITQTSKAPGCSPWVFPTPWIISQLGNGVSTFSWLAPSASQVWGGPTPSQSTTHQVSLHKQEGFFHPSFSGKALLKQHFRDNSVFP